MTKRTKYKGESDYNYKMRLNPNKIWNVMTRRWVNKPKIKNKQVRS